MTIDTLEEIQLRIHAKYDTTDTEAPDSDSDDYLLRTELANDAIDTWEQEGSEMGGWAELYTTLSQQHLDDALVATDAMREWASGTTVYDAPTNFVRPVGFLTVTDPDGNVYRHEYVRPEKVQRFSQGTTEYRYYFVTGNRRSGYKINIVNGSYASGSIIDYPYYKSAAHLSDGADKPEMSNPRFIVLAVLADLFSEDDPDRSAQYQNESIAVMQTMKLQNIMALEEQRDRVEESVETAYGFGG